MPIEHGMDPRASVHGAVRIAADMLMLSRAQGLLGACGSTFTEMARKLAPQSPGQHFVAPAGARFDVHRQAPFSRCVNWRAHWSSSSSASFGRPSLGATSRGETRARRAAATRRASSGTARACTRAPGRLSCGRACARRLIHDRLGSPMDGGRRRSDPTTHILPEPPRRYAYY